MIKEYLEKIGAKFKVYSHEPVYTCEEADKAEGLKGIRGIHSKNLFVKEKKSKRFYLVIMDAKKTLNFDKISEITGDKIKFANENNLKDILGLEKGAVSPFGLINDKDDRVIVLVDEDVWESEFVGFHPNVNTETLELSHDNFEKYLKSLGNEFRIVRI